MKCVIFFTLILSTLAVKFCGQYTDYCASLEYKNRNIIIYKNELDSMYQVELVNSGHSKKDCSDSPLFEVIEKYVMNTYDSTLQEIDRGMIVYNKKALDYYIQCNHELNETYYYSFNNLTCYYKHIETFYIGLEKNTHKTIDLNSIDWSHTDYIIYSGVDYYYYDNTGCIADHSIYIWIISIIILFFVLLSILIAYVAIRLHKQKNPKDIETTLLEFNQNLETQMNHSSSLKNKSKIHINPSIVSV